MDQDEDPEFSLRTFETLTALSVCVHDLSGILAPAIAPDRGFHGHGPCIAVKQGPGADVCFAFEITTLQPVAHRWPAGRVHRCHAGVVEWMVPVLEGDELLAILFAGQRRAGPDLAPAVDAQRSGDPAAGLAPVGPAEAALKLEALRQLAARLRDWIRHRPHRPAAPSRARRIREFIARHHVGRPVLADLAKHLGISRDRCAHLVREATGRTWKELLIEARLRTAAELLRSTDLDILAVSLRAGWGDLAHFHRTFKRRMGTTPARYRRDPEAVPTGG